MTSEAFALLLHLTQANPEHPGHDLAHDAACRDIDEGQSHE